MLARTHWECINLLIILILALLPRAFPQLQFHSACTAPQESALNNAFTVGQKIAQKALLRWEIMLANPDAPNMPLAEIERFGNIMIAFGVPPQSPDYKAAIKNGTLITRKLAAMNQAPKPPLMCGVSLLEKTGKVPPPTEGDPREFTKMFYRDGQPIVSEDKETHFPVRYFSRRENRHKMVAERIRPLREWGSGIHATPEHMDSFLRQDF